MTVVLLLRRFAGALATIGVLAYAAAALVTVADIVGRRVGMPVDGVVDLVQLFVVTGAWLVMPYAFLSGAHVSVDFVVAALPRGGAVTLRLIAMISAAVLLTLMLWQGYNAFQQRLMFGDRSQQLGIAIIWYWLPLLVGLAGAVLVSALAFLTHAAPEANK